MAGERNPDLYAAVLANPDDDAPRLVYADWLAERGDPWGELITTQIARTRSDTPELAARELELLAHMPRREDGIVYGTYRRGFLEALITSSELLGRRLVDSCVRELHVCFDVRGSVIAAALPRMRLRSLSLDPTSDDDLVTLLNALDCRLDTLTYGRQYGPSISAAQVRAITQSKLRVSSLAVRATEAAAVAAISAWHPLRALSLEDSKIGLCVFENFVDAPAFANLERLELSNTDVGEEDVYSIAASAMPLVELGLSGNIIGSAAARWIADTPRFAALRRLRLADCGIGEEGLEALLASPYLSRDLQLFLDGDVLGMHGQIYYDGNTPASSAWLGAVPDRVAARFRVTVEGVPECVSEYV